METTASEIVFERSERQRFPIPDKPEPTLRYLNPLIAMPWMK